MRTRVKFCGINEARDIDAAVELGVDAVGFIFAPSPRRIDLAVAQRLASEMPAFMTVVGVFIDPDELEMSSARAAIPQMVPQFCGQESPARCASLAQGPYIKVIHVAPDGKSVAAQSDYLAYSGTLIFDTQVMGLSGGSGKTFDWNALAIPDRPVIIAGGLNPQNVGACIRTLRPYAVDVRSGIESGGRKDAQKMRDFVAAVRYADREGNGEA